MNQHVATLDAKLTTRIDYLETAFKKQTDDYNRVPTLLQTAVETLRSFIDAKLSALEDKAALELKAHVADSERHFAGIEEKFHANDVRLDQQNDNAKESVERAFAANEKAMSKTEAQFDTRIKAVVETVSVETKNLDRRITDLKDTVVGQVGKASGSYTTLAIIVSVAAAGAAFWSIFIRTTVALH